MGTDQKQCAKRIYRSGGSFRGSPCSLPVKVTDADGQHWCAVHDPEDAD